MASLPYVCSNSECGASHSLLIRVDDPEGLVINVPFKSALESRPALLCRTCGAQGKLIAGQFEFLFEHNDNGLIATRIGEPILHLGLEIIPAGKAVRKPQEVHKNLVCTNCGCESEGIRILFNEHTKSVMGPMQMSALCKKCGQENTVDLGTITIDEKGLKQVFNGPEFTPEVLLKIKEVAERLAATPSTASDFTSEVNAIVPSLGDKLEAYIGTRKNLMEFLKFLITVLTATLAGLSYFSRSKPASAPAPIINNYYSTPVANPLSTSQLSNLRRVQNSPASRGINLTPPKKKRIKRK